jgi:predicted transcriptional regulator
VVTIISISADKEVIDKFRDLAHKTRRTQKDLFAEAVGLLEEKIKEEEKNG